MLSGRHWAMGEIFGAIGDALGGGKKEKTPQKGKKKASKSSKNEPELNAAELEKLAKIRKNRMRGILSAIENGGLGSK